VLKVSIKGKQSMVWVELLLQSFASHLVFSASSWTQMSSVHAAVYRYLNNKYQLFSAQTPQLYKLYFPSFAINTAAHFFDAYLFETIFSLVRSSQEAFLFL